VVTHQLQVERRTAKERWPETTFVLPYSFSEGHRKSLSEPGESCSTSMSLVCIATSLVLNKENDDDKLNAARRVHTQFNELMIA